MLTQFHFFFKLVKNVDKINHILKWICIAGCWH